MFYKTHSSRELGCNHTRQIQSLVQQLLLNMFSLFLSSRAPRRSLALRARLYSPLTGRQDFHGRKFTKRNLSSYCLASHVFSASVLRRAWEASFSTIWEYLRSCKNRAQTLPSSFLSPQTKGWVKIGKIFFIRK